MDRRDFGSPLIITNDTALVEQAVLFHSAFFYGHAMSSLAGVITNVNAARGTDPRTMSEWSMVAGRSDPHVLVVVVAKYTRIHPYFLFFWLTGVACSTFQCIYLFSFLYRLIPCVSRI